MSKQSASSAVLAVATTVPEAIEVLNKKIADLKHIQDSVYVTSGKIKMSSGELDIKSETSVDVLVTAFSSVQARAEAKEKAYETLGINTYPQVKIDGSTVEEWKKDITLRIQIIEHKETLDKLQGIKKEWEELMDKEDRKALLLKKMQNI